MGEYIININDKTMDMIKSIADYFGESEMRVMEYLLRKSARCEVIGIDEERSFSPSYSPSSRNNINNNINTKSIELKEILSKLNTNSNPIDSVKKPKRKKPKVNIPKNWVDDRDAGTLKDAQLIAYAEKKGYDWYAACEMFKDFVDYSLKRGSQWVNWYRAWQTWVRNSSKFYGAPTNKPDSVIRSYESFDPGKELD